MFPIVSRVCLHRMRALCETNIVIDKLFNGVPCMVYQSICQLLPSRTRNASWLRRTPRQRRLIGNNFTQIAPNGTLISLSLVTYSNILTNILLSSRGLFLFLEMHGHSHFPINITLQVIFDFSLRELVLVSTSVV